MPYRFALGSQWHRHNPVYICDDMYLLLWYTTDIDLDDGVKEAGKHDEEHRPFRADIARRFARSPFTNQHCDTRA